MVNSWKLSKNMQNHDCISFENQNHALSEKITKYEHIINGF
jgi:hypothetical protein